jgi:predicted RecA/RadA family phage recombinase
MAENADFLRSPSHYKHILFTVATGGINAGEIALVSEVYVLAFNTYAAAAVGVGVTEADMCEIPKSVGTGLTIAAGDFLYLNTTTLVVSTTQGTGDLWVGWAIEAATATATHVKGCWKGGQT